MKYVLSLDPGFRTGIILGCYTDETPYERIEFWQVDGGLEGLIQWMDVFWDYEYKSFAFPRHGLFVGFDLTKVCEKFVPIRSKVARTFKTEELEPIRIEGALRMELGDGIVWQRSSAMVLAGGETPAERKRNSDDVLRNAGLWLTGKKDLGMSDANDANAAQKHAIAYMRSLKHEPTMREMGLVV